MSMQTITRPRCPLCGLEYNGSLPGNCGRANCGVGLMAGPGKSLRTNTFRLVQHFSLCVLPFSFSDPDGKPAWERIGVPGRWKERVFSADNPDDMERTEYFLPYIRRFLFPGLTTSSPTGAGTAGVSTTKPEWQSCWHFVFDLPRLGTIDPAGLALTLYARDNRKNLDYRFSLVLEKIELIVFRYRVGFLVLHFQNSEEDATYFEQMDALTYLRTLAPLYPGFEMPELALAGQRYRVPDLLRYLLAEFGTASPPSTPSEVRTGSLPVKPIYDDRMMVYAFSCLDRDSVLPDIEQCEALLRRGAVVQFDPEAVTRPNDRPRECREDWLQERRQGFSKDGGILVVFATDRYHARFLGGYQKTYYFDIFLLAALQRIILLTLFETFSDIHTLIQASRGSRRVLRRVRRDLLLFKNQCWFSQITNRERGLVLWKKWQSVFENRTLLSEVNEQSEELDQYLQTRYRERMELLVRMGSFLAATVPTVYGIERFLGEDLWVSYLRWGLLGLLILGTAVLGGFVLIRQRDEV